MFGSYCQKTAKQNVKEFFLPPKVDTNTDYDLLQSKTIDWLRFPLMFMVVFIHVCHQNLLDMKPSVFAYGTYFTVSQVIARIAVPLFFIISGYYFFFGKGKTVHSTKIFTSPN